MQISINELSVHTGFSYRTIKKRLAGLKPEIRGHAHLYRAEDAMPLLYAPETGALEHEKARLAHHQANLAAIKERELRSKSIPTSCVLAICQENAEQARERLSAVVGQVARKHPDIPPAVLDDLERFIGDALVELPPDGVPDEIRRRIERGH